MNIYCNSLFYLIALDFATRSFELINDKEFRKVMKFAEGFIIWLIFFLSCNVLSRPAPRFRFERMKEVFLGFRILLFHPRPCVRMYVLICAYLETGCCRVDRRSSWNASIQRDSIVRAAYKTRLIRSTYTRL